MVGNFFSINNFEGLELAKIYFHTGFLATNTSCIQFRSNDIDRMVTEASVVIDKRLPTDFKLAVNFRTEDEIQKIKIIPLKSKDMSLQFTSDFEESSCEMMEFFSNTLTRGYYQATNEPYLNLGDIVSGPRSNLLGLTRNPAFDTSVVPDKSINNMTNNNILSQTRVFSSLHGNNELSQNAHKRTNAEKISGNTNATSADLVEGLLKDLGIHEAENARSQIQTKQINHQSTFLANVPNRQTSVPLTPNKKVTSDTFSDLLGEFKSTLQANNKNRNIGEMKTQIEMPSLEEKVFAWKNGKARNVRALIGSLDKILWEGSTWHQCGMHQLVTQNDVNRMYKKACRAVHPDKNNGTENEELATLIQKELNDAWSEYKKGLS